MSAIRLVDALLASLTAVIWGVGFVAIKFGLQSFSAPQLTALRFIAACLPAVFVAPPRLPWRSVALIGLTLFAGQFLLLFFAFTRGLPPGVASVTQQVQALFTVLIAAAFLHDTPAAAQWLGLAVAFAGLVLIGSTVGADLTPSGLALALGAAMSWAIGNILVKQSRARSMFSLVVWASLVPPLPALAVSAVADRRSLLEAVAHASWLSIAAAVYLGVVATIVAYAVWGDLLQRYPAAVVAPFALLVPCAGVVSSVLIFGETFSLARYTGMALIFAGLAVILLPATRRSTPASDRLTGRPDF